MISKAVPQPVYWNTFGSPTWKVSPVLTVRSKLGKRQSCVAGANVRIFGITPLFNRITEQPPLRTGKYAVSLSAFLISNMTT